jgi:hypothetical protein
VVRSIIDGKNSYGLSIKECLTNPEYVWGVLKEWREKTNKLRFMNIDKVDDVDKLRDVIRTMVKAFTECSFLMVLIDEDALKCLMSEEDAKDFRAQFWRAHNDFMSNLVTFHNNLDMKMKSLDPSKNYVIVPGRA